ncbi:MAG: HAD-IA family hydrolase [Pseudomonadales bacterium]
MKRIKVIAFDLDDTLWDSKPVLIRAEQYLDEWLTTRVPDLQYTVADMRDLRPLVLHDNPELAHYITELRRRVIEIAMQLSGLGHKESKALSQEAIKVFLAARNEINLPQETMGIIRALFGEFTLGSLTNGNANIHSLGLSPYFSFAYAAEDVGASKPASDLFHAALRHTNCRPPEMVYVGDDPLLDIDPANAVGLRTVMLQNPRHTEPGETEPDEIITRITELPDIIERFQTGD